MSRRFAMRVAASIAAACMIGASCGDAGAPAPEPAAPPPVVPAARVLDVGDPAPDFSLPGSDGRQYSLSSYRGRQAVVLAWFAKAFTEG